MTLLPPHPDLHEAGGRVTSCKAGHQQKATLTYQVGDLKAAEGLKFACNMYSFKIVNALYHKYLYSTLTYLTFISTFY